MSAGKGGSAYAVPRTLVPNAAPRRVRTRAQAIAEAQSRADGLLLFSRDEFLARRFRYRPGEHLTVLGPTGYGKTRLLDELGDRVFTPELPGLVLAMKPCDDTMDATVENLGLKKVKDWPPPWTAGRQRGYAVWPAHTFDPDQDDVHLYEVFRRAILDSYKRGGRIVQADEFYGLVDVGLARHLIALWTRGRSMGVGLWGGSQKPTHIPLHAYSQAEHLFLANDPTVAARKKFGEIGGVDPYVVLAAVERLEKFQWLYIRRDGARMCVVDR